MKKTDIGQNVVYEGNKDAFLAWCLNKAVQQELEADTDVICSFLSANVELWVQQAMTWDYCYTMMSSIIYANNEKKREGVEKAKKLLEEKKRKNEKSKGIMDLSGGNVKIINPKPTNIIERRQLFASKYEAKFS